MGEVYEKKIVDGKKKLVTRWNTKEECQHVKNAKIFKFQEKIQTNPSEVKGPIKYLLGKAMEVEEMGKYFQLSVVFYILSKGCAMTDYPSLSTLLHFLKKNYYLRSHWFVNNGWEWEIFLVEVEKENIKAKIKE